jgi:hypothetical protein
MPTVRFPFRSSDRGSAQPTRTPTLPSRASVRTASNRGEGLLATRETKRFRSVYETAREELDTIIAELEGLRGDLAAER